MRLGPRGLLSKVAPSELGLMASAPALLCCGEATVNPYQRNI